jgi:hypothetical protein
MRTINIKISLTGHCGQEWPKIKVLFNNKLLFDGQIQGQMFIEKTLAVTDSNVIEIVHYDKLNDTQVNNDGKIISDRYCLFDGIWINNIMFDLNFFSEHNIMYCTDQNEKIVTNYFGANGTFKFKFLYPLWVFWESLQ